MHIQRKKVNLDAIFNELRLFFKSMAEDTRNAILLSLPEDSAYHYFDCDETKLKQILINLISNALKFTREGEVTIGARKDDQWIHFFVKDTGIGIPEESMEHIFERFVQVEDKSAVNYPGTGLGLAICQKLVELMNGDIWVESKSGFGSVFHFVLPVNK